VIAGGTSLQPALYALVLEKLFPHAKVSGGRLYYCTSRGDFRAVDVPLDGMTRESVHQLADTLNDAFTRGFFPAAPAHDACRYCDFVRICGPYEEKRTRGKSAASIERLVALRRSR
jgi:CRISPR/Cas system-associated exonuclease Cas4 (RecB family)